MQEIYCHAPLNYAGTVEYEPVEVALLNGRSSTLPPFDECGFAFLSHESAVRDWRDEEQVNRIHVPEVCALAKEHLGCAHTVGYPALIRSPETAKDISDYAPIESVHSDYTEDFRRMVTDPGHTYQGFLQPLLEASGLTHNDVRNASRLAVIQFWRNIGDPCPDRPLALCDSRDVPRDELIAIRVPEYGGMPLDFEVFAVRTPTDATGHHWYTFPALGKDEVLAFRTYDSLVEDQNRAFWTPHSAFVDPLAANDAPMRESVEMRVLCLFE